MLRELNREIDFLNGSYIRYTEIYECNAIPMPIISLEKITTITRKNKMKFHFKNPEKNFEIINRRNFAIASIFIILT